MSNKCSSGAVSAQSCIIDAGDPKWSGAYVIQIMLEDTDR